MPTTQDVISRLLREITSEEDARRIEWREARERGDIEGAHRAHTVWAAMHRLRDVVNDPVGLEHPYSSMSVHDVYGEDATVARRTLYVYGRPVGSYTSDRGLRQAIERWRDQPNVWGALPVRLSYDETSPRCGR